MPKTRTNDDQKRAVTLYLSKIDCELLACLSWNHPNPRDPRDELNNNLNQAVAEVLQRIADHAVTGVYRPGCWERPWIAQIFSDFEKNLEPGDPYGRNATGDRELWQRPKQNQKRDHDWLKKVVPGLSIEEGKQ